MQSLPLRRFALLFSFLWVLPNLHSESTGLRSVGEEALLFEFSHHITTEFPQGTIAVGRIPSQNQPTLLALTDEILISNDLGNHWNHLGPAPSRHQNIHTTHSDSGWVLIPYGSDNEGPEAIQYFQASSATSHGVLPIKLPGLPVQTSEISAAVLGDVLYVVALQSSTSEGEAVPYFGSLNLSRPESKWTSLPVWPGAAGGKLNLAALHRSVYLFTSGGEDGGQNEISVYNALRGWRSSGEAPVDVGDSVVVGCGDSHLIFLGVRGGENKLIGYHVITHGWAEMGTLPDSAEVLAAVSYGDVRFQVIARDQLYDINAVLQPTSYGWADNLVLIAFMGIMVGIGVYLSRRKRTKSDYFRGGRQIPFWASGLSLFATGASGISLMAMPGRAFEDDWAYLTISFFVVLSYPLVLLVYVPIARRLNVSTANEYLERRYNLSIRLAGSVVYSLNQILARLAAIMILPAIAISAIAGIPMETSILVMGLVTTLYATLGGLEGVIWTDVIQAIVMLLAVFLCATWALIALQADPGTAFAAIQSAEKLRSFDLTLSILGPTSLVLFANVMATTVAMIGDQNFIQRVQCTPTEKDARKAVITQISVAVPLNVILFSLGTILFLFYRERPEMLNPTLKADGIFPLFAAQNLPAGLAGLVIAALFAATMSTLSSAINSTANLGVEDFYRRLYPRATPRGALILGRTLTGLLGVIGTLAALWLLKSDLRSVWDLAIMLTGMILAPIAGIFFLGIFTTRAHSTGVILGAASAILATYLIKTYTPIHHFLYLPVGVASCILVGYLASLFIPSIGKDLKGLTAFTIFREKSD